MPVMPAPAKLVKGDGSNKLAEGNPKHTDTHWYETLQTLGYDAT